MEGPTEPLKVTIHKQSSQLGAVKQISPKKSETAQDSKRRTTRKQTSKNYMEASSSKNHKATGSSGAKFGLDSFPDRPYMHTGF